MARTFSEMAEDREKPSEARLTLLPPPDTCVVVEGLRIDLRGSTAPDWCGLPSDPKSEKLIGHSACPYHLEQELHGMLGGEG